MRTDNHKYGQNHIEEVKTYKRKYNLGRRYGITIEEADKMLVEQDHQCAICGDPIAFIVSPGIRKACIDHNHDTSMVRGLLCHSCNTSLGLMERPEWLEKAQTYLGGY